MRFYRVGHKDNQQGMWYNRDGSFAGRIHRKYKSFANNELQMPYNPEIVGFLSTTDSLETLFMWFPPEDIMAAYKDGYRVMEYEASDQDIKFNTEFHHWLVNESVEPVKVWNWDDTIALVKHEALAIG